MPPRRSRSPKPLLVITAGDPCGVGPEVILKALRRFSLPRALTGVVIGDHAVFARAATRLRVPLPRWQRIERHRPWPKVVGPLAFVDCAHPDVFEPGRPSRVAGQASLVYLEEAMELWKAGGVRALVTAPVTKWTIEAGCPGFVGHTEYLARATGNRDVVMMFVADALRVVLLTRHLPLSQVARAVDRRLVRTTLRATHQALRRHFQVQQPRLAVCGLNPHAGEEGLFGREERMVLLPVLRELRAERIACDGPFAADGFFPGASAYDAVICWYHDQGLIPFKLVARHEGCQVSLGLPFVRTSPDHGSALDIAGRGRVHAGSMLYALRLAARLSMRAGTWSPMG